MRSVKVKCFLLSERLSCSCDGFREASEQEAGAHVTCRLADGNFVWSGIVDYSQIYSASLEARGDGPLFFVASL